MRVYEQLIGLAESSAVRVFPANDMVSGRPHLFVGPTELLKFRGTALVSGCAIEKQIKGRPSIYTIQAVVPAVVGP